MKTKRKKLSITKRLVILNLDKCKRCNGKLRQRRVYPFPIACSDCNEDIIYEDEVAFNKETKEKFKLYNHFICPDCKHNKFYLLSGGEDQCYMACAKCETRLGGATMDCSDDTGSGKNSYDSLELVKYKNSK